LQIFGELIEGHLGVYSKEARDRGHIFSPFDLLDPHFQIT
jgi:hypothetical protein